MRKLLVILVAFFAFSSSFATSNALIKPRLKASEILIPIGNGHVISVLDLSEMSIREVETLRGKKMKMADRIAFKAAQHKLRQSINYDGTLSLKMTKKLKKAGSGETGFHIGGFALGFLLGLIGVLIAYLINDDFKRNRVKWSWLGLLASVLLSLLIFALLV